MAAPVWAARAEVDRRRHLVDDNDITPSGPTARAAVDAARAPRLRRRAVPLDSIAAELRSAVRSVPRPLPAELPAGDLLAAAAAPDDADGSGSGEDTPAALARPG